jgi:nucleotide-binding universal stress UspA family protein
MIEGIVESREIDLVVLGYEEKSIFEQLFKSDTTERMLHTHTLPVLLVP